MKTKIYQEYVNRNYLQELISLGDVFGVAIRNVDARTREGMPYRIYFTNGRKRQGFIDEEKRNGLSTKYFELNSPLGKIKGDFCYTMDPEISFSLAVRGRPYDTISGIYHASFPKNISSRQSIHCSLLKDQQLLQSIDFDSNIELSQCFKDSPEPYERLFIKMEGVSNFSLLHEKNFDKRDRSMLVQSQILKRDSELRMVKPTQFTVECAKGKVNPSYHFDYANIDFMQIYDILSQYDDGIFSCLDHFHDLLTFENLDLYQNMVSACFPSMDSTASSLITGVEAKPYQKNLELVSRLNAQKR